MGVLDPGARVMEGDVPDRDGYDRRAKDAGPEWSSVSVRRRPPPNLPGVLHDSSDPTSPVPAPAGLCGATPFRERHAMTDDRRYGFGDRVIHADKPEWGEAVVTGCANVTHEGKPTQRLTLRFERAGLKHLVTAIADIRPAGEKAPVAQTNGEAPAAAAVAEGGSWLDEISAGDLAQRMATLPESTRDPFASLAERLRATMGLYRFRAEGGSLLDWAATQTGLSDPLSRFSRHELEEYFRRYQTERAKCFKRLLLDAKHQDPRLYATIEKEAMGKMSDADKQLLRRINVPR
ncbi:MAG: hypothetical protein Tsb0013_23040 [Phycisphaerales bacterium]